MIERTWFRPVFGALLVGLFLLVGVDAAFGQAYSYQRSITIDHTKVPNTDQPDFPVLISGTYSYLATVANGGKVQNASGYDIIFTTDAAGTNKLDHEIDSYNPTTGAVSFWVRIPNLSHTSDTVIYIQYGNAAITTSQENKFGVWKNGFISVQHMSGNSSDSIGAHSGTDTSMSYSASGGFIGQGASFSGTGYISDGGSTAFTSVNITFSAWINASSFPNAYNAVEALDSSTLYFRHTLLIKSNGKLAVYLEDSAPNYDGTGSHTLSTGTWYYVTYTYDGATLTGYVNGGQDGQASGRLLNYVAPATQWIGNSNFTPRVFNGKMDEVRFASVARTPDWIATEFNNQNSPSSFYTVGLENGPTITGLSPVSGIAGTSITISGNGFGSTAGTVTFNGRAATASSWSDASIIATVPSGASSGPVVVTTSSSVPSNAVHFTVPFSYSRSITIAHSRVPNSDQSNIPILISGTYLYLATVANGGKVQNANGYDIIFTADPAGINKLDHEIDSYNQATGAVSFWVRIPNLSHTTDTVIYMQYGNAAINSSQENKAGVWSNNYAAVWHFSNGNGQDSTGNGNNTSVINASTTAGQIGGAFSFNGSNQYLRVPSSSTYKPTGAITLEAWATTQGAGCNSLFGLDYRGDGSWNPPFNSWGLTEWCGGTQPRTITATSGGGTNGQWQIASASMAMGQWYHLAGTYNGSAIQTYVNGAASGSPLSATGTIGYGAANADISFGVRSAYSAGEYWNGNIDEARISTVVRSADWIATEYNNQSSPSSFYGVSAENAPTITSVSPGNGVVGTSVAISGNGFGASAGTVTFNGVSAIISNWSDSAIIVIVPAGATSGPVVATRSSGLQSNGFSFGIYAFLRTITIDHTKVGNEDLLNFPVLISGTYSYLATAANGGKLQNPNGYDLIFADDVAGNNRLDHEIETYSPANGAINVWVRIPMLSHTTDTTIYMLYGNSGVASSQQNPAGIWQANYQGVWHMQLSGNPLAAPNSTGGQDGAANGATSTTGLIGGAANFSGSSQDILLGNLGLRPVKGTISMWVQAPALANYPNAFSTSFGTGVCSGNTAIRFELNSAGVFGAATGDSSCDLNGVTMSSAFTANAWHYATVTWDSSLSTETGYLDGVLDQTITNTFWPVNFDAVTIGAGFDSSRYWKGQVDEVRISNAIRSADWIAAEYKNQGSPSTFYSIGAENTVSVSVSPASAVVYGSQTQQFVATILGSGNTAVTWSASPAGTGSISSSGLYTAPVTVITQQTVTVTATSAADSTKSASASITLEPPISVSVAPLNATAIPSQSLQFSATLTNTSNSAVTWSINPAGTGSVSSSGLYAAPATISAQQTVTITATSVADTTKSGSATITLSPVSGAFSYHRPITISHTMVPNTDQVNFPVLISGTYGYLATVTNGGKVQNASGYDVVFTTDAAGTTKLDHEIETYDPTTGTIDFWVRIPTLSHSADTVIYMHYGDAAITASLENKTGVWNSNYLGVWHLANGSTLNSADSTANGNNGSNNGATPAAGQIDGAAAFNGTNQFIALRPLGTFSDASSLTLSAWVNPATNSGVQKIIAPAGTTVTILGTSIYTFVANLNATNGKFVAEAGKAHFSTDDAVANGAYKTGQWSYLIGTFGGNQVTLYVNGVKQATTAYSSADTLSFANTNAWSIGKYTEDGTDQQWWNGFIDEVRVSNMSLSPDWIATEYNNQSSASTFYSLGSENTISVSVVPAAIALYANQTQQFSAATINAPNTAVTWSISSGGAGSISSSGLYTAPSSISTQQTVTVTATSAQDNTKTASATVTLYPPASVSVTPATPTLYPAQTQQFSASVSNAVTQLVRWSISPALGSISSAGLYTAPAIVSSQQTVTIKATSVAEPSQSGTATVTLGQWSQAYSYRRAITISHTQVPNTDQTNFPVLISGTYSYLATVANGGKVQNGNGYDIIFTSDATGSTKLDHEIDSYNPATGTATFWVRIPTLSHTTDTVIYMQYGNSSIATSQENKPGVWSNAFISIQHMSGSSINSLGANNGTDTSISYSSSAGFIGQGAAFPGSGYINDGTSSAFAPLNVTFSAWVNGSSFSNAYSAVESLDSSTSYFRHTMLIKSNGKLAVYLENSTPNYDGTGTHTLATETWYYLSYTYDGTTLTGYVNGAQDASVVGSMLTTLLPATQWIGNSNFTSRIFNGKMDEVRFAGVARSADWIATEYNNQSSPSTFYTAGVENAPLILSLSPASGEPGTSVTVSGMYFGSSPGTVTFNGTSANVSNWTSTSITAIVPNGSSSGPVVVTSSSGVQGNGFAFTVLAPFISGLNPNRGPAGTSITISGSGFGSSAGTVTFNSVSASASNWTDTSITATVPSGAGMGNVIVTSNGIQSNPVMFGAPFISGLNPPAGPQGTSVTISGASFSSTAGSVTFDGVNATTTNWTDTSITATVPTGALSGPVVVTVQGVSSNPVGFLVQEQVVTGPVAYSYDALGRLVGVVAASGDAAQYNYDAVGNILSIVRTLTAQPSILSFTPTSGPVGTTVTIAGSNFNPTAANDAVSFHGTSATVNSATSTQLVVTLPSGATSGPISLTVPAGTATSSSAFTVSSSSSKPAISSFTPQIVSQGGAVTISGSSFDLTLANDRLIVNTTVAAAPTSVTSSSMVLAAPASGSGRIYLSTPAGQATSAADLFIVPSGNTPSQVSYTGRTTLGSTATVSIPTASTFGLLLFDGSAGKSVNVSASSSTLSSCTFSVYQPNGKAVGSTASCGSTPGTLSELALPVSGTYAINVAPASGVTGSVAITISDSTAASAFLTTGNSVTLNTAAPGQNVQVEFSAVGGQQATLQFSSNTLGSVTATILNPDGSTLSSTSSSATSFSFPVLTLPQTGVFTVLVTPSPSATGGIQVGLTLAGGDTAVPSRSSGAVLDSTNPLAANLAGLFVMNENTGTTDKNLVDNQPANFSGVAQPTWWISDPSIVFQGGASLNSYLDAGTDLAFDQLTPGKMTVVAKVLARGNGGIAEKNDGNDVDSGFVFGVDSTGALRLTVERAQANMQAGTVAQTILNNQWVQVAFTWDGTVGTAAAAHLYLNGVEQSKMLSVDGSGTVGYTNATNQSFRIGNADFDFPGSFSGRIAYLAVYKGRILSTTEMGQLDTQLPIH